MCVYLGKMCVGTITIATIISLLNLILLKRIIKKIYNHFFTAGARKFNLCLISAA